VLLLSRIRLELIDANGVHGAEFAMFQSTGDDLFHRHPMKCGTLRLFPSRTAVAPHGTSSMTTASHRRQSTRRMGADCLTCVFSPVSHLRGAPHYLR